MPDDQSINARAIRAQVREANFAARRLMGQAVHMEKRARRARADVNERVELNARAVELRAEASLRLAEVSQLWRKSRAERETGRAA